MPLKIDAITDNDTFGFVQGPWRISYWVHKQKSGAVLIRKVEIRPNYKGPILRTPDAGITTTLLRQIALEPARRDAVAALETQALDVDLPATPRGRTGRRRGRPVVLTEFYKAVAKRWSELTKQRDPHVIRTLAEEFKKSRSNMAGVIRRCREKKLLPPSGARKRGPKRNSARRSAHRR